MTAKNTNCRTGLSAYEDTRACFTRLGAVMSTMNRAAMKPRTRWIVARTLMVEEKRTMQ